MLPVPEVVNIRVCQNVILDWHHRRNGPKYEHAQEYGHVLGLQVVPFSWLVDSVKLKVRLNESAYTAQIFDSTIASESRRQHLRGGPTSESCPSRHPQGREGRGVQTSESQSPRAFYIDPLLPEGVQFQVREDLQKISCEVTDESFAGGKGSHVVCDLDGAHRHLGRSVSLVTPVWVSRSAAAGEEQPLLHCSPDIVVHIARELRTAAPPSVAPQDAPPHTLRNHPPAAHERSMVEVQKMVDEAKEVVRSRRGAVQQPCRTLPRTPTPVSLLEYVCWAVTDPPEAGLVCGALEAGSPFSLRETRVADQWGSQSSEQLQAALEMRPLTDRELDEVEYRHPFLTLLFPIDRYGELGVRSRNLHSAQGFSRRRILRSIYEFYQEGLSDEEVQVAIHTDSRHADHLRLGLVSTRNGDGQWARCKFLGSRKSYDGLRRVGRDICGQVYELSLGA